MWVRRAWFWIAMGWLCCSVLACGAGGGSWAPHSYVSGDDSIQSLDAPGSPVASGPAPDLVLAGEGGETVDARTEPGLAANATNSGTSKPSGYPTFDPGFIAFTEPGDVPQLRIVRGDDRASKGAERTDLPLKHTRVRATIVGYVGQVEVTQVYDNPSDTPIDAEYVFPLPENSAVHSMRMKIGDRNVEAHIMERQLARRTYEQAKQGGLTAALLEQERTNVFTQTVANIAPGKQIEVVVQYFQDLSYDAGEFEFVFPMVVGPRFFPGQALDAQPVGNGTHPDTDVVFDASRVSPPIVGKGTRSGRDISIEVIADATTPIRSYRTPTHDVIEKRGEDETLHLTLAPHDDLPNRDFVLRYRVDEPEPHAELLTSGGPEGFFSLVVHPPQLDVDDLVGRREVILVVDVSGSMSGAPLGMAQSAIRDAIGRLRPVDTFNLITFAGATGRAFPVARPANHTNIREALEFVDRMRAGGGTYMLDGIQAALGGPVTPGRHRYVFFLTDGLVGNEDQILVSTRHFVAAWEEGGQRARVFGFGVGSSVNRHLLDGLATSGKGLTVYATHREDPARAVNQFYRYIDRSVLRNLTIDFAGMATTEVMPSETPDLFASHPLILHGRYRGEVPREIRLFADSARGRVELTVPVVAAKQAGSRKVLGKLWARAKVGSLEEQLWNSPNDPKVTSQIVALGLEHHLVTKFTSLLAVDYEGTRQTEPSELKLQLSDAPEDPQIEARGVRHDGFAHGPAEPSPTNDNIQMMEVSPDSRGCFCRAAGGPAPKMPWGLGLGLVALVLHRARRQAVRRASRGMSNAPPGA